MNRLASSDLMNVNPESNELYIALLSFHALYWGTWQFLLCVGKEWQSCSNLGPPVTTLMLIFLMFEAILFAIFTSVMFGTQLSAICSDETAIESLKRGSEDRQKVLSWKKNMQSVFGGPCSLRWLNPLVEPYVSKPAFEYSV
uniref:Palmitoyltransferase n=1 Tax=Angiostrongylus cantonensis TaxID=6313 RepID=A0A158PAD8_ANGCA